MKFIKLMLVALALSATINLSAEQTFGVNFTKGMVEDSGYDADVNALVFNYGYVINEWAKVEARAGMGLGKDNVDVFGTDVGVSIDSLYGVYGKFGMDLEDGYYPYFILGYTETTLEAEALGVTVNDASSDVSYGLGLEIKGNDGIFAVEFMNYMDKDGVEFHALSFGYSARF